VGRREARHFLSVETAFLGKERFMVKQAVIAAAGRGTRFLPATKTVAKELLPLLDRPIIQHVVEEVLAAGVSDILIVARKENVEALQKHFRAAPDLEHFLRETGKTAILEAVQKCTLPQVRCILQGEDLPYGNGSPALAAKPFLEEGEPFLYLFGDDVFLSDPPCAKQVLGIYEAQKPDAVVASIRVPWEDIEKLGSIRYRPGEEEYVLDEVLEKVPQHLAPTNITQLGRYVFPYEILDLLENQPLGKDNELWMADAVTALARQCKVLAPPIRGRWLTTGDPLNWLKANVEFALAHGSLRRDLLVYLQGCLAAAEEGGKGGRSNR